MSILDAIKTNIIQIGDKLTIKASEKKEPSTKSLYYMFINEEKDSLYAIYDFPYNVYGPIISMKDFLNKPFTNACKRNDIAYYARYYVSYVKKEQSAKIEPLYLLTQFPKDTNKSLVSFYRKVYKIGVNSESLKDYVSDIRAIEGSNQYYKAVSSVMSEIRTILKEYIIIVGYTLNEKIVKRFEEIGRISIDTAPSELQYVWETCHSQKSNILNGILGENNSLSSEIFAMLVCSKNPFEPKRWSIIKHQIKNKKDIINGFYYLATRNPLLIEKFRNGEFIEGIDFGNNEQFLIMAEAVFLDQKPDGTQYIDDLHDDEKWFSEEKMKIISERDNYNYLISERTKDGKIRLSELLILDPDY